MPYVCGTCKDVHAKVREGSEIYGRYGVAVRGDCARCGDQAFTYTDSGKYAWAPPRKSQRNAWRLIRKGELLWDRRRMSRVRNRQNWRIPEGRSIGREATYGQKKKGSPYSWDR